MNSITWYIFYESCTYFFVGSLVFLLAVAYDQELAKTGSPFYTAFLDPLNTWVSAWY